MTPEQLESMLTLLMTFWEGIKIKKSGKLNSTGFFVY